MKVKGLRWVVLSMIMLVSIINYLDRGTLSYMWVANQKVIYSADNIIPDSLALTYSITDQNGSTIIAPFDRVRLLESGEYEFTKIGGIATELGIVDPNLPEAEFKVQTKKILASITIFFMIAYGLSQLFSGKLYDKIGTRKGFALSAILWGAADAFTFLASGLKSLTGFRFMLGLGEAGPWPGTTKSNAEWLPTNERAFGQGLFNASTSVGAILAPIVIGFLYLMVGWKLTFVIVGSLAVIWVIPWLIINKKGPKEHPWITDEEKEYILSGQPESQVTSPIKGKSWGELLKKRKNYALIIGRFFIDPVWWMFVTFIPIYLIEQFNLDIKEVAFSAWVPYVGAAIGAFSGGWFSGYLQKRGHSLNFSRKTAMIVGASIAIPGIIGATMSSSALSAVLSMAVILCGYQFYCSNIQTLAADFHYGKTVGSLAGLGGAAAVMGTILAMYSVPFITQISWVPFFVMGGLLFPVSLFFVLILGGKIQNIDLDEKDKENSK